MQKPTTFSKNRHIAFVCFSSSLGGLELSLLKLASEFNRREADCILVVPPETSLANYAVRYQIKTELLKPKRKYFDIAASTRLASILKSNKTEVVVAMQSKDINVITLAHLIHPSVKLVFFQEMQSGINKRDLFHTWMYSKLALWITLTKKMKQEVITNTRVPAEKIRPIPIGSDMHHFDPQLYNRADSRDRFGIPQTKFVIGMLGRLDPQKGQEEFIRTMPSLLQQQSDLHFVIAGDESHGLDGYKKYLMDLGKTLGVNHSLQFIPFTDEVPEFISALDMFVLPSHSETFGFVLVEAMAMGKPIVATDSGGVPEIISDGITGLLIPPRNTSALTGAILQLIKDEKLRLYLSSEARSDAQKRFNIEQTVDQLVLALDSL
jgi:glycosyltransferase involved in cell wall biosynthesis